MTDITPERVEALASELRNNRYTDYRDTLRALSAEVARLKADNAAKDAVIVRQGKAINAAFLLLADAPKDSKPRDAYRALRSILDLTPDALADCVVVQAEDLMRVMSLTAGSPKDSPARSAYRWARHMLEASRG